MGFSNIYPKVSVVIPSYNHEKYIKECLQSVLDQTFQDFEIIITDDSSSDNTVNEIREFKDPRIRLFEHKARKGASVAANNCITKSRGKYVAMLSSDDVWHPNKIELQVNFLENNPNFAAVFSKVKWIDEYGFLIDNNIFPLQNLFNVKNRTRFEWLRHFFYFGNCLCHPSSLIRREFYTYEGLFNPTFANLPDFDMWVRLCTKFSLFILDEELVNFRFFSDRKNASGDTLNNNVRIRFEYKQILSHFLRIQNTREFLQVFPDANRYGEVTKETIKYFLGRIALDTKEDFKILWGLELISNLLENDILAEKLKDQYNFTYLNFIHLSGNYDIYKIALSRSGKEGLFTKENSSKKPNLIWKIIVPFLKDIKELFYKLFLLVRRFVD